jgi:transcriptional regulator with XRE-family HTH domain
MLNDFGLILRDMRVKHEMQLDDFANALGIASYQLSSIETGKELPSNEILEDIVLVLANTQAEEETLRETYLMSQIKFENSLTYEIRNLAIKECLQRLLKKGYADTVD